MLVIVFAFIANAVSGLVPPLRDEVTLTALGEKREEASAAEVYLDGYTVDGKKYSAGEDLKILGGKWFWKGETYCWRIETDTRQPEGTTRSVTVSIPVGWDRTLNFAGDVWRGLVEITAGGMTWTVDTYSEDGTQVTAQVSRSETSALIWNQVRYLAVYAVILAALSAAMYHILLLCQKDLERTAKWWMRNEGRVICALTAVMTFVLMLRYAEVHSLWGDDLKQIGWLCGTIGEAVKFCLNMVDVTPPLYAICSWVWYHIAPYGERWLLLISIIPAALAVYWTGRASEKISGNRYCGIIAALFFACSYPVWCHTKMRSYTFVMLFSALSLYRYVCRNETLGRKQSVHFSCALTALAMSHYFGMIACAGFFLADVVLMAIKKVRWKTLLESYLLPAVVCIGWLTAVYVITLSHRAPETIAWWYPVPDIDNVRELVYFLSGQTEFTYLALLFGIAIPVVLLVAKRAKFEWNVFYRCYAAALFIGTLALLYIYGNCVNQKATMWWDRYFLFLVPYGCYLSAAAICDVTGGLFCVKGNGLLLTRALCLFLGVVMSVNCILSFLHASSVRPLREGADWLYTQVNDIYNNDTLVLIGTDADGTRGWNDYYVTRQGRRDPINVRCPSEMTVEEIDAYNTIYMQSDYGYPALIEQYIKDNYTLKAEYANIGIRVFSRL